MADPVIILLSALLLIVDPGPGGPGDPGGGPGGPGGHWASSALGEISNPQVSEAGSIFPGTPNNFERISGGPR